MIERGALAGATAACGAFFFGAGVDWLWESTAVAVLALVLLGAAMASTGTAALPPRLPVRVALALAALSLCLLQLPALVSTSEIRESQRSFASGNINEALAHANDAIETEPWASAPYVQRALVRERNGNYAAAAADLSRATARSPEDWRIPLVSARVLARQGDADAAIRAYRRAQRLRPQGKFFSQPVSEAPPTTRTGE